MDIERINIYRKELMGVASIWIFIFHVWQPLLGNTNVLFLKNLEWYIKETGYCGVEIFLLLSGIGLVYAIHKQNLKTFYLRRFLRVYPAFFIWFTLSTLIRSDKMDLPDFLGRLCFYSNWTENLLAYKWYISAILMFYLWFPLYYSILKRQKYPVLFTLVMIGSEISVSVLFYSLIRSDLFLFINRIPIFLLGVLLGHLCIKKLDKGCILFLEGMIHRVLICGIVVFLLMISYYLHRMENLGAVGQCVKNMVNFFMVLIICMGFSKLFEVVQEKRIANFVKKWLAFLGSYSLEFYLTHELISLKIKEYSLPLIIPGWLNQVLNVIMCFTVSLIAAWVLKWLVDIGKKLFFSCEVLA